MSDPIPFDIDDQWETQPEYRVRPGKGEPIWPRLVVGLFAGACLAEIICMGTGRETRWLDAALPVLACAAAGGSLAHRLSLQNQAAIAVILVLFTSAFGLCTAVSGMPYGPVTFTDKSGPMLFQKLPILVPLLWVAIIMTSREVGRLILYLWRRGHFYGYWLIGIAALLSMVVGVSLEPFGSEVKQYWIRTAPETFPRWYGTPLVGYLGWGASVAIALAFASPWFINKKPVRPPPRLRPVWVWAMLNLFLIVANATRRLWPAVAVGSVLVLAAVTLACLGCRKHTRSLDES